MDYIDEVNNTNDGLVQDTSDISKPFLFVCLKSM
jgi:hypothetical protein